MSAAAGYRPGTGTHGGSPANEPARAAGERDAILAGTPRATGNARGADGLDRGYRQEPLTTIRVIRIEDAGRVPDGHRSTG
jgi:hypothetical protein